MINQTGKNKKWILFEKKWRYGMLKKANIRNEKADIEVRRKRSPHDHYSQNAVWQRSRTGYI